METTLNQLIRLNVELEGLLRVAAARPSEHAVDAARCRFDEMARLFDSLGDSRSGDVTNLKYEEVEGVEESPLAEPDLQQMPAGAAIIESDAQAADPHISIDDHAAAPVAAAGSDPAPARPELRRMLTLNDKYMFRRELFGGNDAEMSDTLDLIGSMHSLDEAEEYLYDDLQWDRQSPAVADFMAFVANYFNPAR